MNGGLFGFDFARLMNLAFESTQYRIMTDLVSGYKSLAQIRLKELNEQCDVWKNMIDQLHPDFEDHTYNWLMGKWQIIHEMRVNLNNTFAKWS